jgi:Fe-S oxidoreductase
MKMVKVVCRRIVAVSLVLAVAGALCALPAQAQQKGAEKLMQLKTVEDLQALNVGDTVIMSCPKCKDTYAQVVEKTFKAAKPEELKTVTIHLCSACDTKLVTKGHGRQAQDVLVHTCKGCGSKDVSCCVMKKGAGTTPGMEEKK